MSITEPARILIADSQGARRETINVALSQQGHLVELATDEQECIRAALSNRPDLIICALHHPDVDSIAICRKLKRAEATAHVPLLMIAGDSDLDKRLEAFEAGVDDLLVDPVDLSELLARSRMLLRTKRLSDDLRQQSRTIDSLLAISTLSPGYMDASTRMFADFGRHAAKLLRAKTVAVLLRRGHRPPEILNCWPIADHSAVMDRLHNSIAMGAILQSRTPLIVANDDHRQLEDLGLNEGFVGVPIINQRDEVMGAVLVFGTPSDPPENSVRILMTLAQRVGAEIQIQDYAESLEAQVVERTKALECANAALLQANEETIFRLAMAAECRDQETANHLRRIAQTSEFLARRSKLDNESISLIHNASMLHDIGKLGIPEQILMKPGKLTPEEYEQMKTHTVLGAQICRGSQSPQLQMAERIALCHHERWDGQGYPHGKRGTDIPIEARIVAVADIFDALISERPYKAAWSTEDALDHLASLAGTHLDPHLVNLFLQSSARFAAIQDSAVHVPSEAI